MKPFVTTFTVILVLTLLSSCRSVGNFDQRKYTDGQFVELHLLKNKTEKSGSLGVETAVTDDSARSRIAVVVDQVKESMIAPEAESMLSSSEVLHDNYPVLAARMDSTIARQMQKDSTWKTDTLPDAIDAALSSQAMLGLGTVGGLICMASPNALWLFILPMILAPLSLLISLIAAAIAMGKINRGEIDGRYRKWMKLWAVCLLVNLVIGSVVLMHYVFL